MTIATIAGTASTSMLRDSSRTRLSGRPRWRPRSPVKTASTHSPTVTGRSSTSCAPPTSRPARAPSIRTLGKASGVPIKELYQLFPKGPAKLAAKIGGIPKPRGCI